MLRSPTAAFVFCGVALACLSSCGGDTNEPPAIVNEADPYIARALNDPLMVDPDLSYRNEANAAITIGHDHALPSFKGSAEAATRAREVARLELLEDGAISELPFAKNGQGPASLKEAYGVQAVLAALEVPARCSKDITGNFAYAASMPEAARVMPHGMVRVAAAVDQPGCSLRLVRYVTPAAMDDALQYHFTLADRANLNPAYHDQPERSIVAGRRGTQLMVFARQAAGDLTAVDIITWTRG